MNTNERLYNCGIIPVVVVENSDDAVSAANAMLAGDVDVMEITFRTAAAADSIKKVSENCPDMLVGAGTVTTLKQCKTAVSLGAKFIVGPGFSDEIAAWCGENNIDYVPGCVTPTEIMMAQKYNLKTIKFFPASVYGGLSGMKALSGPFPDVKFVPTGGVNSKNLQEFVTTPCVFVVGGSWICKKDDISQHNFEEITDLCKEARKTILGYEFSHIGINPTEELRDSSLCDVINSVFGFKPNELKMGYWAGPNIEALKENGPGKHGHIAVYTNSVPRALVDLEKRGYIFEEGSEQYVKDKINVIYLKGEYGGFAIHLLQRPVNN